MASGSFTEKRPPQPVVRWNGRWAKCLDGRIFILAASIVDVELIVSGAEQLPFAMKELSQQVQEGLPPSIALTLGV
ncbi:unnamed protein product [Durusdinium trenchii]|uniref:Uncharacterized protein n=1 Tax=Durusdinium trenchii TaxID=1381693 RepID=A0ABP0KE49_9DINO